MNLDDTIFRDLNRIVNDRGVSHQHRNVVRQAITILNTIAGKDITETNIDPSMVACVCAKASRIIDNCSHCDGVGFITREKHFAILQDREDLFLKIHNVQL